MDEARIVHQGNGVDAVSAKRAAADLASDGSVPSIPVSSKAQLNAFLAKMDTDPALKARVVAADGPAAVVVIAEMSAHHVSPASWIRHLGG